MELVNWLDCLGFHSKLSLSVLGSQHLLVYTPCELYIQCYLYYHTKGHLYYHQRIFFTEIRSEYRDYFLSSRKARIWCIVAELSCCDLSARELSGQLRDRGQQYIMQSLWPERVPCNCARIAVLSINTGKLHCSRCDVLRVWCDAMRWQYCCWGYPLSDRYSVIVESHCLSRSWISLHRTAMSPAMHEKNVEESNKR